MTTAEPKFRWAVSSGSYSDYRVKCIVSSKKLAEQIAAVETDGYTSYFVESIPFFDRMPERITVHGIQANLWDDDTSDEAAVSERVEWEHDMLYPEQIAPVRWRWVRAPVHNTKGGRLEVYGTDLTRVRKVFSDRRALILSGDPLRSRREATS